MHTRALSHASGAALLVALLSYPVPASTQAARALPALFEAAPPGAQLQAVNDAAAAQNRRVRRARRMRLRTGAFDTAATQPTERLLLNLFDDSSFVARRTAIERHGSGFTWRGRLESEKDSDATLVVTDGVMMGTIFTHGHTYEIAYAGNGTHDVREIDPAAFPTDDPATPTPAIVPRDGATVAAATDAADQIDVMVVWTPAARSATGGTTAMQNLVTLAISNANTAYANSRINTRLRLVYAGEVTFTETKTDIMGDLSRLASPGDGALDAVQTLRTQYGADVVSLLGNGYANGSGACGIGYLMSTVSTSFGSMAYNVVDQSCAAGNLSLAHEIGHNQGLHHDPANAGGGQGAYPYAFGYQDLSGLFRTVMSYGSAPRVMYFSNPNVTYAGRATGVANAQDNARALNNTASVVANFRSAVVSSCSYTVSPGSISMGSGAGAASVTITTGSGCTWSVSGTSAWLSPGVTSGSGPATLTLNATTNTGASRSTTLTIAGRSVTVTQAALACSYMLSPSTVSFGAAGGTGTATLTVTAGCGWTISGAPAWLAVSPASGAGGGTITLSASSNGGTARTASLTIASKTLAVSQAAALVAPGVPQNVRIVN